MVMKHGYEVTKDKRTMKAAEMRIIRHFFGFSGLSHHTHCIHLYERHLYFLD